MLKPVQQTVMNALMSRGVPFGVAERAVLEIGAMSFDAGYKRACRTAGVRRFLDRVLAPLPPHIEEAGIGYEGEFHG